MLGHLCAEEILRSEGFMKKGLREIEAWPVTAD